MTDCPFCKIRDEQCALATPVVRAFFDSFPISKGHTLVVPIAHVSSLYELTNEEQASVWLTVAKIRQRLQAEFDPDGFNIGVNDGPAAGQTVPHAHIHVIPRYAGDVEDPRGGIRWVLPSKANYWSGR